MRGRRSLAHISPDDGLSEPAQKNIYDIKETMNGYDSDVTLEREEDPGDIGDAYPRFLGHTFAVCDPDECVEEVEIDSEHVTNSITEKCDKKRCDLLAELWRRTLTTQSAEPPKELYKKKSGGSAKVGI